MIPLPEACIVWQRKTPVKSQVLSLLFQGIYLHYIKQRKKMQAQLQKNEGNSRFELQKNEGVFAYELQKDEGV